MNKIQIIWAFLLLKLPMTDGQQIGNNHLEITNTEFFVEAHHDFPREEKNLRKWDSPVIADLDRDGYVDMILNDHGFGIRICWNNGGKFSKPYDLIMGDLHGVTVGDIDQDGNLEIVISRGGGSGGNARNAKIYSVDKNRTFTALPDFDTPLELMRGRTVKLFDGDNDGDLDLLNLAFPDKDKKGKSENYIYKNDGKGQLILTATLPPIQSNGQKTLLTDFNGDHIFDLLLYGHGNVQAYKGKGDLTFEEVTDMILPYPIDEVTSIIEIDYDNDGDFDLYFTRGKDFNKSETFYDKESKILGITSKRGKTDLKELRTGEIIKLENFQSQWPYNDAYYIGETEYEYTFPGETHSGKNIRLVNSNALGFPDYPHEDGGIHIGYIGNQNWRLLIDTWSPTTGIVRGVQEFPSSEHHPGLSDILLENNNGKYTDITTRYDLDKIDHTMGCVAADLDNNGFQDLVVIRRGNLIHALEAIIYMNQEAGGFVESKNHGIVSSELGSVGMAIETTDYDDDGKMDIIIGNERGKWHLYKNRFNQAEENNQITVVVGNSTKGTCTALGAVVELDACGVTQRKRIGTTSAPYSLGFNNQVSFGLSTCTQNLNIKVTWTNGETITKEVDGQTKKITIGN